MNSNKENRHFRILRVEIYKKKNTKKEKKIQKSQYPQPKVSKKNIYIFQIFSFPDDPY